jgi:hypothetical protein
VASPFDFVKSASSSIDNEILNGKLARKDMNSFMFLRALGNFEDTVLYADEINSHSGMPAEYVYHCMHALIQPKRNRFSKWIKPVDEYDKDTVARVIDIFECSRADALNILDKLKEEGRLEHFMEKYVLKKEKNR